MQPLALFPPCMPKTNAKHTTWPPVQVAQLAGLPAALDDANQRLFELRVEVQNAGEDGAITTASIRRQVGSQRGRVGGRA